jgi:hypothetical protein
MIAGVQRSADETLIEYGVREGAAAIRDGGSNMALARPTGLERADAIRIRIPIEGAGALTFGEIALSRVMHPNQAFVEAALHRNHRVLCLSSRVSLMPIWTVIRCPSDKTGRTGSLFGH